MAFVFTFVVYEVAYFCLTFTERIYKFIVTQKRDQSTDLYVEIED